MVQLILSFLVVLLWTVAAQATNYYVATTGNDANAGTDETVPLLTFHAGIAKLAAGDTLYIRSGTYTESTYVRLSANGTQAAPIRIMAYPGEAPVITFTSSVAGTQFLLQRSPGHNLPIGWITIEGLTITGGSHAIKWYNCTHCTVRKNKFFDTAASGLQSDSGTDNLIEQNIFMDNGSAAIGGHGMYITGSRSKILNNIFIGYRHYGIQFRGNWVTTNTTDYPSPEFAMNTDSIVNGNIFAYSEVFSGIVNYGGDNDNIRVENNIFYQNDQDATGADYNGIDCVSCGNTTGWQIRNNVVYSTSPRSTTFIDPVMIEGTHYTQSNNRVNVAVPGFVNAPATYLRTADFRLLSTADAIGKARANEFPNNATLAAGPFAIVGTPAATITTNKIRLTFPMSTAVPIQNITKAGLTVGCTGSNCPGSPGVSSVSRVSGTDSIVEIVVSGITGDACVATNQNWTVTYDASTGTWTGNDYIGPAPGLHQPIFSFTNLAVANQCTGSGPPGSTPSHISYPMEDGSGTTVSDTSGNAIHATTSGTWVAGKTGTGVKVAGGTTQQTTIPYGSGIDPTSQSMTWVVPVFVATGQTQATNFVFGTEIGTNQRGYLAAALGTWVVGRQTVNTTTAGPSSLAVTEGWNHLCARWDSATDTVTLYKNGVAGTGGATGSYTSYTFPANFEAPILGTGFPSTVTETIYDDTQIFTSLQDCAALYAAWNAPPPAAVGTLAQVAIQFQGVILDTTGNPIVIGPAVQSIEVPAGGGVVLLFQVHCTNVADCDTTAFKLTYTKNSGSTIQQVPGSETADGTWMWGVTTEGHLNNGIRSTRLTGSCAVTDGSTQLTSAQIPSVDLPQDGCVVLAYIVRVGSTQAGNYFDYKLRTEADLDFTGGYTQTARVRVVNPMANVAW